MFVQYVQSVRKGWGRSLIFKSQGKFEMGNKPSVLVSILFVFFFCAFSESYGQNELKQKIITLADEKFAAARNYSDQTPGLLVGVWSGSQSLNLTYALGLANTETDEVLTKEHSFKIASVTKSMVTTVIAQYMDEGLLTFDTPLSTYYPTLKQAQDITIRMLGDMTSGYYDYLSGEYEELFDNTPNLTATAQELIDEGLRHAMHYHPGNGMNYSNTNTVILGQIIEKISGQPLETQLKARLFTPLGMSRSGAPASGSYMPAPNAHSYHPDTSEDWTNKMDYSPEYACGNAYSVLSDLKIWAKALATGSMTTPETHQKRLVKGRPFPEAPNYIYHFGLIDYNGFLGHSGDTDYYQTEAYHHPEKDITIIVLSNSSLTGFTGDLFRNIVKLLENRLSKAAIVPVLDFLPRG